MTHLAMVDAAIAKEVGAVIPALSLTVPGRLHASLRSHLFPGDGREAAAVLLCARAPGGRVRLLARDLIPVPHGACASRRNDAIAWPGEYLEKAIDVAEPEDLADCRRCIPIPAGCSVSRAG